MPLNKADAMTLLVVQTIVGDCSFYINIFLTNIDICNRIIKQYYGLTLVFCSSVKINLYIDFAMAFQKKWSEPTIPTS